MDEIPIAWLIGAGTAMLLLRTLMGVADSNLVLVSRARIRQKAEDGDQRCRRLDVLLGDRHRLHAFLALSRTTLSMLLGGIAVAAAAEGFRHRTGAQALVLAAIMLGTLFCEMLARRVAWRDPERLGTTLVPFYALLDRVGSPVLDLFACLTGGVVRLAGQDGAAQPSEREVTGEDIRMLVEAGQDLEEREKEMIHSIFELSETLAREVMVPRVDMKAVEADSTLDRALDICNEHRLSRLPVFEGSVDHVIGVLSTKDLLQNVKENRMDVPLRSIVRPAFFVPGSKKVDELLREMQREKVAMAIVVDEYGGTDGLITMEDLVEEIVGEITDEYDREGQPVESLDDGSVSVDAKMIIEDVNEILETDLPADAYETIGGYVYGLLGHVPHEGETHRVDGLDVTVEEVQRQRITRVRLRRTDGVPFTLPSSHLPSAGGKKRAEASASTLESQDAKESQRAV